MKAFISTDPGAPAAVAVTGPKPTPSAKIQTPAVQLLANWVSPVYVSPGQPITFNQDLRSSTDMGVAVDFEVHAGNGTNVVTASLENQPLAAGQLSSLSTGVQLPGNMAPGSYTIKVGVYSADRATQYASSDTFGTFVVDASPAAPAPAPAPPAPDSSDGTD